MTTKHVPAIQTGTFAGVVDGNEVAIVDAPYVPRSFAEFRRNVQTVQLVQWGSIASGEFVPNSPTSHPFFGVVRSVVDKRSRDFQFEGGYFLDFGKATDWTFAPGVATKTDRHGGVLSYVVTYSQEG